MTYPSGGKAAAFNVLSCGIALECHAPSFRVEGESTFAAVSFDGFDTHCSARITLEREAYPSGWTERILLSPRPEIEGARPVDYLWRRSHDRSNLRADVAHLFVSIGDTDPEAGVRFLDDAFAGIEKAMADHRHQLGLMAMRGSAPFHVVTKDPPRVLGDVARVV